MDAGVRRGRRPFSREDPGGIPMLNWIWASFFFIAFIAALVQAFVFGHPDVFKDVVGALFDNAKTGFEISLGLTGVMYLWLGMMKIGEKAGAIEGIARTVQPLFLRLFPGIPKGHPAAGAIVMNMSANMLGLDNAATPLGLKAMKELQTLNPEPDRATDEMVLFLVINTASVTILPISIFTFRAQMGAADPTDVFVPILIATYVGTLAGLLATAAFQKIRLFDPVVLGWLGALTAVIGGMVLYFSRLPAELVNTQSALLANVLLFGIIVAFLAFGAVKKLPLYETFIEGAKEGFQVAIGIVPYLVAILVAVGALRASGVLGWALDGIRGAVT